MRECVCVFVVCVYMVCESASEGVHKCVGVWCVCEIANERVYVSLYACRCGVNVLVQM